MSARAPALRRTVLPKSASSTNAGPLASASRPLCKKAGADAIAGGKTYCKDAIPIFILGKNAKNGSANSRQQRPGSINTGLVTM